MLQSESQVSMQLRPFLKAPDTMHLILADMSKCLLLVVALLVLPQAQERENPICSYRWDTELDS